MKARSVNPGPLIVLFLGMTAGAAFFAAQPVYGADFPSTTDPNSITADLVEDGIVNFADFSFFSQFWMTADCNVPDWCQGTDLDRDGTADMNDLVVLADHWLVIGDVNVPDVSGLSLLQAQSALVLAGLSVGTILQQYSDTVPADYVISQSPPFGARALHGTAVDLLVSQGVAPVTVPNVVGLAQAQAETAISAAGLALGTVTQQYSETIISGNVISQHPPAGDEVPPGSTIDLVISKGLAPVIVPGVVGLTNVQAEAAITAAGLVVGTVTQEFSATVPADSIISQNPPAGLEVPPETEVDLIVSKGVLPITVPDVTGLTQTQAEETITTAGLILGSVSMEFSETVPADNVISQDPPAGAEVPPASPIDLAVSKGAPISVPDVVGLPRASAETVIAAAGLSVGTVTHEFSTTVPFDDVISQNPLMGTEAVAGTPVDLVLSQGAPVTVPDTTGLTPSEAQAVIASAGLMSGAVTQEPSAIAELGRIGRQFPPVGEQVVQGTTVDLFVSTGPTCFYVAKTGSDQNDGSSPTDQGGGTGPFATIQQGLTVLANRDAVGDVLCIRGGVYYEECTGFGGINAVGPVVIKNYNDETVYVDGGEIVTGWTQCDPNEPGVRVCGLMPPDWNAYCQSVYKARVETSRVYTIPDRPYYGVKLVYENKLLPPCGVIDMPEAAFPDLENYGWTMTSGTTETIRDVTHLVEPDGFWNKALVWFTGSRDNIAYCRTITDSNSVANTITFDACDAGADQTKKYWICNHPHYLNDPGEYYWDPNSADGYYTIYYYKRPDENLSDPNTAMKVLSKSAGIRFTVSSKNLIIEGLGFRNCQTHGSYDGYGQYINGGPTGQCGFICATNWCNTISNITIRNCTFENFYGNEGGAIVFGECEKDILIDNCIVRDIGRGAGMKTYGQATDKTQGVVIKNCTLEHIWGSNIRPYFADNIQVTGNTVSQFNGVHGNAITVYGSCDNVLIAHNVIIGGTNALVMKDTHGMYIFGNVFRSTDDSGSVSVWDVDYRAVTGNLYVLHNTILTSSSKPKALFFLTQNANYPPAANVVIKNNILDGLEYAVDWNPLITHDFNLYLEESTHQASTCPQCAPWVYGANEIRSVDSHFEQFTDYSNQDYTLQATSNAVGAGADLSDELAVLETAFPFYDFTVDRQGTPWQSPASMGAFEQPVP